MAGSDDNAELEFSRVFDSPPEVVFACFIDPTHLTHFWAPLGASAPVEKIHIDPRPGGRFETLIVNDRTGATYATCSVFLDVQPPTLLAWREEHTGMRVRVTFTALPGERTLFRLQQRDVPDIVKLPENQVGFTRTLDKLAHHLRLLTQGAQHENHPIR